MTTVLAIGAVAALAFGVLCAVIVYVMLRAERRRDERAEHDEFQREQAMRNAAARDRR